tara:strand:- start:346 stop:552 length:207 start_codon:yes stop_codon:yes gene_type:complete
MSEINRYKLLELSTNGWLLMDNKAQNLTKEECDVWIQKAMNNGVAQNRLKVARQEDPRYPETPESFAV